MSADVLAGTSGDIEWGADNTVLFYSTQDAAHRPHKVWRHVIGTPQSSDVCLLSEEDERFWVSLSKSDDGCFLFLRVGSKLSSELRFVHLTPATQIAEATLVAPREADMLYKVCGAARRGAWRWWHGGCAGGTL